MLGSERAAKSAESEAARMISGGEMPVEETIVQDTIVGTPKGLSKGIAGTKVITDSSGNEKLVYTGSGAPVIPGTPALGGPGESDGLTPYERFYKAQQASQRQDAFQAIVSAFKTYGIEGLADTVFALMADPNIGDQQAIYKLKYDTSINPATNKPWNEAYSKRFAANAERIKAGKPAISEAEYLTAERTYARAFRSSGVPGLATRQNFDKLIAGDVSADEAVDRVNTVINRIQNAPKETKDAIAAFYPNLSITNIAEAVLDPEVSLPALKRQIAAAEIGGGAISAGLGISRARAEELGALGVTGAGAREGFQAVAEVLPGAKRLSDIYREAPLTQAEVESEVFKTAGAIEAKKKRQALAEREVASFSARAGATQGALARDRAGAF